MIEHGHLADILLVRHFSPRREPRENGVESSLDGNRAQHRHQQANAHQGVAAEIGIEAPGPGEELLAIGEEGQGLPGGKIASGRVVQQVLPGERHERRLAREGRDPQTDRTVRSRGYAPPPHSPIEYLDDQPVADRSVEPVARPRERPSGQRRCDSNSCRESGGGLIVAQHSDAGQHCLPYDELALRDGHSRRNAVKRPPLAIARSDGPRLASNLPRRIAPLVREPEADATIAGREGDEDARHRAGAQQQVRRDGPLPQEVIENPAFAHLERELWLRGPRRCRRGSRQRDRQAAAANRTISEARE